MDELTIDLEPRDGGRWTAVRLRVNGRDLTEVAAGIERDRGYAPLVPYDWISVDGSRPASERLTGQVQDDWPGDGRTLLLVCGECGEEGCWPITARIDVGPDRVVWEGFKNDQWPDRDYSSLEFAFNRAQYEAEVSRAFDGLGVRSQPWRTRSDR